MLLCCHLQGSGGGAAAAGAGGGDGRLSSGHPCAPALARRLESKSIEWREVSLDLHPVDAVTISAPPPGPVGAAARPDHVLVRLPVDSFFGEHWCMRMEVHAIADFRVGGLHWGAATRLSPPANPCAHAGILIHKGDALQRPEAVRRLADGLAAMLRQACRFRGTSALAPTPARPAGGGDGA